MECAKDAFLHVLFLALLVVAELVVQQVEFVVAELVVLQKNFAIMDIVPHAALYVIQMKNAVMELA